MKKKKSKRTTALQIILLNMKSEHHYQHLGTNSETAEYSSTLPLTTVGVESTWHLEKLGSSAVLI